MIGQAPSLADSAIALHREGKLKDAVRLYEQVLEGQESPDPALRHFAGMAWLGLGRTGKALPLLECAAAGSKRADFHVGHGNALYSLRRFAKARDAFTIAAGLDPMNASTWFNLGNAAGRAHDVQAAVDAFEKALEYDPLLVQALVNLSALLATEKRFDEFAALLRRVQGLGIWRAMLTDIALIGIPAAATGGKKGQIVEDTLREMADATPINVQALCLLGNLLFMRKDFTGAEACYSRVEESDPTQLGARRGLGLLLAARGQTDAAREHLTAARVEDPEATQVMKLANLLIQLTERDAGSVGVYWLLCELYPESEAVFDTHLTWLTHIKDWKSCVNLLEERIKTHETPEYLVILSASLMNLRRDAVAIKHLRRALKLDRRNFAGWFNLATVLTNQNKNIDAFKAGKKAVLLDPHRVDAVVTLALIAGKLHQYEEEDRIIRRGLKYTPRAVPLLNLMGNNFLRKGNTKQALKCYERAREYAGSTDAAALQMQLMSINYADVPAQVVADAHFSWGDATVTIWKEKMKKLGTVHAAPPAEPRSRLKIGYLSGDYKNHSCSFFLMPLMANHDPARVDVHCYMSEAAGDEVNLKFRRMSRHWRELEFVTDEDAAQMIRDDGIDILVDLSGHTSGARLDILAQKPAPLIVNWLGYPNTTGLSTVDYRFTDAFADPVGMTDKYFREQLYRLPNFLCYQPPELTPPVAELPALAKGFVTFGCFNNSNKITDEVVDSWARIMKRVPGSHMVLKTSNMSDKTTLAAFRAKFERNGIEPERIQCFESFPNKFDHLMTYGDIDLALDPFPYNGTTTTFESLWMGVPMITLEGKVHAGRVGHAILSAVGLPELSAATLDDYVEIAAALACDPQRIAAYRKDLRARLRNSPLMDGKAFARTMENAYFDMWSHAVANNTPSHSLRQAHSLGQVAGAKTKRN